MIAKLFHRMWLSKYILRMLYIFHD
eukprot:UN08838